MHDLVEIYLAARHLDLPDGTADHLTVLQAINARYVAALQTLAGQALAVDPGRPANARAIPATSAFEERRRNEQRKIELKWRTRDGILMEITASAPRHPGAEPTIDVAVQKPGSFRFRIIEPDDLGISEASDDLRLRARAALPYSGPQAQVGAEQLASVLSRFRALVPDAHRRFLNGTSPLDLPSVNYISDQTIDAKNKAADHSLSNLDRTNDVLGPWPNVLDFTGLDDARPTCAAAGHIAERNVGPFERLWGVNGVASQRVVDGYRTQVRVLQLLGDRDAVSVHGTDLVRAEQELEAHCEAATRVEASIRGHSDWRSLPPNVGPLLREADAHLGRVHDTTMGFIERVADRLAADDRPGRAAILYGVLAERRSLRQDPAQAIANAWTSCAEQAQLAGNDELAQRARTGTARLVTARAPHSISR